MALELAIVDAFTDTPFRGNPAAVAVLDRFPDDGFMQSVSLEMNLSETAFCAPRQDGAYDLRWFTPTTEVDLCGHATLATAHVLGGGAEFHTRSGLLTCVGEDGWIRMDLPADPPVPTDAPTTVRLPGLAWYGLGKWDALAVLEDPAQVRNFSPDLSAIAGIGVRGLIVSAVGDRSGFDCVSRVFAPSFGIPEDPVTGSAHCTLAAYWSGRLGRDDLVGEQASPRGGTVRMRCAGDRVGVAGQAVTVARVSLAV